MFIIDDENGGWKEGREEVNRFWKEGECVRGRAKRAKERGKKKTSEMAKVRRESKKEPENHTSSSTFFSFLLDPSHPGERKEKKV